MPLSKIHPGTITVTSDNKLVVGNTSQRTTAYASAALTVDSSTSRVPLSLISNSSTYPYIRLDYDYPVANGGNLGLFYFYGRDTANTMVPYGYVSSYVEDNTSGSPSGKMRIGIRANDTATPVADFTRNGIELGSGSQMLSSGIKFPASQKASSDPNTLDDYEEGTWTPTLTGGGVWPTISSYNNQYGFYRKIGSLVFVSFYIYITSGKVSGGSGDTQISGLPFNAFGSSASAYSTIATGYAYINGTASGQGSTGPIRWQINANNGNYLSFYGDRNAVWGTGMYELSGTGCYMVYQ